MFRVLIETRQNAWLSGLIGFEITIQIWAKFHCSRYCEWSGLLSDEAVQI